MMINTVKNMIILFFEHKKVFEIVGFDLANFDRY